MKHLVASFTIFTALFLGGCANTMHFNEVSNNNYLPGQGPLVSDIINEQQKSIKDVASQSFSHELIQEKFETDTDFKKREANSKRPVFLVAPLNTAEGGDCESEYDKSKHIYKIANCFSFLASRVVLSEELYGESFSLANAFDSRSIKRKIINTYRVLASFNWQAEYQIPIEEAKKLDNDLMVGIIILEPQATKSCNLCKSREIEDDLNDLSKSLAKFKGEREPLSSSDWRNSAFKEGQILELWDHTIATRGVERIVIFRKSDQRVLSDKIYSRIK